MGTALMLQFASGTRAEQKVPLTIEAIFGDKSYEPVPSELRWSPDGNRLGYFLPTALGEREFWVLNIGTGDTRRVLSSDRARELAPSPDQAPIGEIERTRRIRYGVSSYVWDHDGNHILFVSSGRLYHYDLATLKAACLAPLKNGLTDARFSPDGKWVSFIYEHDIWVVPSAGGRETRLTLGGGKLLLHGEPDWLYQEEFDMRSGYQWSPDSGSIVFIELNESSVPVYPLIEQSSENASVENQRYPKAGDPNPVARIGIVSLKGRKTVWLDKTAEYIPRIDWADNGAITAQLLNRAQNELQLMEVNAKTGRSRTLLTETDAAWLEVSDNLTFLSGGREFLWTSNRSGFQHMYLYSRDGRSLTQVTSGDWVVSDIVGVDEPNGWIYYQSNQFEDIGLNLFRVRKDGSGTERLTRDSGTHKVYMNGQHTAMVDFYSSLTRPQEIHVHDLSRQKEIELFKPRDLSEYDLVRPEMKELKTPDGALIRLLLYKPVDIKQGQMHPLVVYVYGMPGSPTIQDAWYGRRGLFHQFLVQQGFLVAQIDDRSSALPGHKYAVSAYRNLGTLAAKDHEYALRYLKTLPFVDGAASAVWGWSGGGYTAAYHMTHTKLFKAGIAVAPVTDWRLYDSVYTERFMGMPDDESDAYDRASAVKAAPDYSGRLLLMHGTLDDNVHPQNTIQLIRALIEKLKQFDLMLYPGKTHSIPGVSDSIHLYTKIYDFLEWNLRRR